MIHIDDDNICAKCGGYYSAGGYCTNGHLMYYIPRPPVPDERKLLQKKMIELFPSVGDVGSYAAIDAANTLALHWSDHMCEGHAMADIIGDADIIPQLLGEWLERLREEFNAPKATAAA